MEATNTKQISKVTQSLTTAEDMQNQTKLVMQPYANWESYLSPAPLSIAILGELVFISGRKDFAINKNPPVGGYKYIKYPNSSRACLMDVCNLGWRAFNEAHNNMNQIRLNTAQVPYYMDAAVKILFQRDDKDVQALLPDLLNKIRDIADECVRLSGATEEHFTRVIKTIHELLEVCMSERNTYDEELEEVKNKLEEAKLREKSAQQAKERTDKLMKAMENEMSEAREQYQKAMDSIPSGWEMIGMDVVGGITLGIIGNLDRLTSAVIYCLGGDSQSAKPHDAYVKPQSAIEDRESERDVVSEIKAYSKSLEILKYVQDIQELMNVKSEDDEIAWKDLFDQKTERTKSDLMNRQFERIKGDLDKLPDCPPKNQALYLCKKGIDICKELKQYAPTGKCDTKKSNEIIVKLLDLVTSACRFDCKSKRLTNSSICPKPPNMGKEESKSMNKSYSQRAEDDARFKVEQTKAEMNQTREMYESYVENQEKNEKEMTEILVTMRNCEVKEIDFKTTIEMLAKGMEAMGRVKVQWEKMVQFFHMVSNIVKTSLSTTLEDFALTSEKTQNLRNNANLFFKNLLYAQAFHACNIVSLVQMISGTYTEISSTYLMDRVSSLNKLMTMDNTTAEFEREKQQLRNGCEDAQKGILMHVRKNKKEFERKTKERMERIDRELLAIQPAAPPEKTKMIQEAVKSGFTEEEE